MTSQRQVQRALDASSRQLRSDRRSFVKREATRSAEPPSRPPSRGPRALPAGWFSVVRLSQATVDWVCAAWDAVAVRLHRHADPFRAYEAKLDDIATLARSRLQRAVPSETADEAAAKRLRADVSYQEASIANDEQIVERLGVEFHQELQASIEAEIGERRVEYDLWSDHLGRPAFSERFDDLKTWFADQGRKDDSPKPHAGRIERFIEWAQRIVSKYALPTLVPAEMFFAKPGFQILTPDDKYAALAAAIVFAGLLVLCGSGLASFVARSTTHSVRRLPEGGTAMEQRTRWGAATVAGLFLALGLSMAASGAYLRSKVPEATANAQALDAVGEDEAKLEVEATGRHIRSEEFKSRFESLAGRRRDLEKDAENILKKPFEPWRADALAAVCIYLAVFGAAYGKRALGRDPILEYELVASSLSELSAYRRMIINWREAERRVYVLSIAAAKRDLARLRADLGKVSPDDPLALPAAAGEPDAHVEQGTGPAGSEAVRSTTLDEVIASWKRGRLRRYVRAYLALARATAVAPYSATIRRCLED